MYNERAMFVSKQNSGAEWIQKRFALSQMRITRAAHRVVHYNSNEARAASLLPPNSRQPWLRCQEDATTQPLLLSNVVISGCVG